MKQLIRTMVVVLAMLGLPFAVQAQSTPLDFLIASLENQGYEINEVSRTWMGRVIVEAKSATHNREIVLDPYSGEILRDYWEMRDTGGGRENEAAKGKSWFLFLFRTTPGAR